MGYQDIECVRHVLTLLDEAVRQLHSSDEVAHGTIIEATSFLRRQIDSEPVQGLPDGDGRLLAWQARKVRDYIDSHLTGPVPIADLCVLIGRSKAHFSRSFKRTFGESPHAFVIWRRLELAARYMLQTDAPLSDIALRCGFTDQAHLSKHFRQSTGQTPAAWRRARRRFLEEADRLRAGDSLSTSAGREFDEDTLGVRLYGLWGDAQ
jgi:AraC family transcriptional regulator